MKAKIKQLVPNTAAALSQAFEPGDVVLAVNGNEGLEDLFDYQFEVMGEPEISFIVAPQGDEEDLVEIVIEKPEDEDPGLVFDSPVFTPIKTCNNACAFCFIDQQPEGLRPTLYVKDDDWRLSYFCNTYITLTNLTQRDRERMAMLRPGPLYVSVHATTPEVRVKLLENQKAKDIMKELQWLASLEIPFHAQLVICPGLNDGEILSRSLNDLMSLRPFCESVAIVPVGLTQHRAHLSQLQPHTQQTAQAVIECLNTFKQQSGLPEFAFASDEFYVLAGAQLPQYEAYGEFPQLDDGVGNSQLLSEQFFKLATQLPEQITPKRQFMLITGKLGKMVLDPIAQRLNQIEGLWVDVLSVDNHFWGEDVTVAGLITATDIMASLKGQDLSAYQALLIPETMVKDASEGPNSLFLDGHTIAEVGAIVGCPITIVQKPDRAISLLEQLLPEIEIEDVLQPQ